MPADCIYFDNIYYRHMIGRAGRRGYDTFGNVVFYGVPKEKIKNFISSDIANIKGTYSLNVNLMLQISAMQTFNNDAYKTLESHIQNSILKLSSSDYEDTNKCKSCIKTMIDYLIKIRFIDSKFNPVNKAKVNAVLLLRNENFPSIIVVDLICKPFFDHLITNGTNGNLEAISNNICLVLCHFCRVRFILPSHVSFFSDIILPDLPDLKRYLKTENLKLNSFIQKYSTEKEELESFERGFPNYSKIINLPKNSYIYDYFISGKLEEVLVNNHVSENYIWYSMKELRYLMTAVQPLFQVKKSKEIVNAFNYCNDKVNDRFFKINN